MTQQRSVCMIFLALCCLVPGCASVDTGTTGSARSHHGIAYDLTGRGPLIVLIHGSNLDRRMWDAEFSWMRERARVLRLDLRGQGGSDTPVDRYSNHGDLIALLDELEEREAILIGLSSGAQVALDVALEAPRRVRQLVLVSPSLASYRPDELPPFFAELSAALRAGDLQRADRVLLDSPIMDVPDEQARRVEAMVEDNRRLWTLPYELLEPLSPPALERLDDVRPPTLILVGENDLEAIHDQARMLEQQVSDARRIEVPGGGHLLNLTSPEAFRAVIEGVLDSATE